MTLYIAPFRVPTLRWASVNLPLLSIVPLGLALLSASAIAQYYDTPEAALAEFIAAYKARDVSRYLAALDFKQEAKEFLTRSGGSAAASDAQVQEKANALRSELDDHFAKFGFKAATFDDCKAITKFEDNPTQVRIVLSCRDTRGSSTFPMRVHRSAEGWRVVRGA
jgi:hypothetical protein